MMSPDSDKKNDVLADNILRAAGMSVDDLKSLGHVFKDATSLFCENLRQASSTTIDGDIRHVEPLDDGALDTLLQGDGVIIPVKVKGWGCTLHLATERVLVFSMLEAMFGAQGNLGSFEANRPLTALEHKVADMLFGHLADALDRVFGLDNKPLFNLGQASDLSRFDPASLERHRLFVCTLNINSGGKSGLVHILLPRSCHRPMQEAVTAFLRRPVTQSDPAWARKMRHEVSRAEIGLDAFIQQGSMTLGELGLLEVGQVLKLPAGAIDQVRLRSGSQQLFKCALGKSGIHFTVKLGDPVNEEEDFVDELVAG